MPTRRLSQRQTAVWYSKAKRSGPSAADAAHWVVLAIWSVLALALLLLPKLAGERRPGKVLLVVDDLDRCSPSEMLSVIENVRLLLDDEEINSRLQVLMLVDEHVLQHAIALRYETMIEERAGGQVSSSRLWW
jgi:hypothetical protein